jgi:DNA-binding NtrC family response regulator
MINAEAANQGRPRRSLSPAAEKALLDYPWPGNIRELKHCLERACILSTQPVLSPELLFEELPADPGTIANETLSAYLDACERRYIEQALRANTNHIAETAAALGISRKNLWEKMKKLRMHERQ